MKKKLLTASTVLAVLLVAGCGTKVKLKDGKEVIASATDKEITAEELFDTLKEKYGSEVLVSMIDEYIISKEIESDKEYEEKAKAQLSSMKSYYQNYNTDWNQVLSYMGYSSDEEFLKGYIENQKKTDIVKKYLKEDITDDEIDAYYEKDIYGKYTTKHILVTVNSNEEDQDKAKKEAYNKAKEAIEKLNNGASWSDVVKEYSEDDQTKNDDGLLPAFTKGEYVDEFFNATIELEDNEYTKEPIESTYGYHIIKRISATEKPSKEDAKDDCLDGIATNKLNNDETLFNKTWINIRDKYEFKIADETVNNNYKKSINQ